MSYSGARLAAGPWPLFRQPLRNVTAFTVAMAGRGVRLMEAQATWIAREQAAQYNFLSIFFRVIIFCTKDEEISEAFRCVLRPAAVNVVEKNFSSVGQQLTCFARNSSFLFFFACNRTFARVAQACDEEPALHLEFLANYTAELSLLEYNLLSSSLPTYAKMDAGRSGLEIKRSRIV